MVVRDDGDVMVQDMGLDDVVEEMTTDEAEISVNGRGRATSEGPGGGVVVWKSAIGVMEVGEGD